MKIRQTWSVVGNDDDELILVTFATETAAAEWLARLSAVPPEEPAPEPAIPDHDFRKGTDTNRFLEYRHGKPARPRNPGRKRGRPRAQ